MKASKEALDAGNWPVFYFTCMFELDHFTPEVISVLRI